MPIRSYPLSIFDRSWCAMQSAYVYRGEAILVLTSVQYTNVFKRVEVALGLWNM